MGKDRMRWSYTSSRKYWFMILVLMGLSSLFIFTSSNVNNTMDFTMLHKAEKPRPLCKTECQHIVFIKVHKAASTTTMNVMLRFALKRNLSIMLPKDGNNISEEETINSKKILPSKNGTYDILCNHVIYDRQVISKYFPSDTKYVAILREPFDQFTSSFMYYRDINPVKYLKGISGLSPISKYLENPQVYEPKRLTDSYTHNRMSIDLGIKKGILSNITLINEFLKNISNEFDLILIVEHYDESMVLLKRTLNWNLEDVLYMSGNAYKKYRNKFNLTTMDRERFRQWSRADYALYNHFYKVFWQKIIHQGNDFFHEVRTFRNLRKVMGDFCTLKKQQEKKMILKATEWSGDITIDRAMCEFIMKEEIPLMNEIKKRFLTHNKLNVTSKT